MTPTPSPSSPAPGSVLVTGGAHRLGAAIARAFAAAGWRVWIHFSRSGEAAAALAGELRAGGANARTAQADLAEPAQIEAMMAQIEAEDGPLRCVVNNASTFEPDTGRDFTPALAQAQLAVNLIAPLLLGRELAAQRERAGGAAGSGDASVVHILDQKVHNLNPDYFSYTVSKLGLAGSVRLQAQALAPAVRVNAVSPGLMFLSGPRAPDNFARASRVNLLQRPIDPAEVARACVMLASSTGITGTTLNVDNGQHLVPLGRDVMFAVDQAPGGAGEPS